MKLSVSLLTLLVCLLARLPAASGHGFGISHFGNQIVANSGDVLHADLFRHDIDMVSATDYTTGHGLFNKSSSPPAPNMVFGGTDTFRFDLVGPLLYSDGFVVTPAIAGVTMDADHTQSPNENRQIDGSSSGITAGFPVSATSSHHIQWTLSGAPVPDGAYAVKYRISAFAGGDTNAPYDPKDVLVVFDTEGATWGSGPLGELEDAQSLLYDFAFASSNGPGSGSAGIPEPGTLGLGLVGLGLLHMRRRRKRQSLSL